jgi:hypothetical protein
VTLILAGECECGARDRIDDTEGLTETLRKGRLAGTELTDQQHQVALLDERGDLGRNLSSLAG